MFSFDLSMKKIVVDFVVSAGVGGSLVERHLEDLRQVRDACMGEDSPKERLRLRLRELGLPLNGRRSDDISLRKLSQAMGINLQHENGNRKNRDELVEALVSALLSEVPVLANFHTSYVEASLKDLRQVRDGLSGQAEQSGELQERLCKLKIKDPRDHVVTLTDLSRALKLPVGTSRGGLTKGQHVEQILTALLAEVPAIASVDNTKTALVDASVRELLALRDGLAGQASQRQELESRLDQFNVRNRSSDVVTLIDLCISLGMATKQHGHYMSGGVLKRQIVEFLLRGSLDAAKKASVDATLQELRRVRDGVEEHAARRRNLERVLKDVKFQHQGPDVVVLQDLCRVLELPIAKSDGGLTRPELEKQIVVSLLAEVDDGERKAALVDATLQELRRVRDGVEEHAARRRNLERVLKDVKFQHQGPDVVVLQDLCRVLELPIAKSDGGLTRPELEKQIVVSLLAEVDDGERKAALVDATLQELRGVRDGVEEHVARRGKLKRCLKNVRFKDQGPDVVVLQDLCRALKLPIAKSDSSGGLTRPELEEQIVVSLLAEVVVPSRHVDQSCFGLAMELCRLFDGSQWDVDAAVRQVCDTKERCLCVGAVLTGTEEENLLGRHQGFEYWVEQLVRLLPGFLQYTRMLRDSLPSDVPDTFRVFPTNFVGDRSKDDGLCRGAKCLAFALAVEFCEEQRREKWRKLFGTEDAVKLGSRFCLILEHLAAEDHRAVDDDVPCLDYDRFVYCF